MKFDLLIKGGEVVDPGGGRGGRLDVAIKRDRIAAVDRDIPAEAAFQVIDASGQYVTPGLVDLHTHVYHHVTFWGIDPDPVAARSGVTTWLDVGSAGAYNWPGFREYIVKPADVRIYGLLNISAIGLTAMTGELLNLDYCDVDLCCKLIDRHRDLILGVKVRIDRNTTGPSGIEPLRRARQAAERCELPLMVHIGIGPPQVEEVLALLRPGDILTHCFTGNSMRIVDERGALLEAARRAWDAGVIMDIGHGAGSFSFETAEALIGAGYRPDVISSDIHQLSINGPLFDMPTCMSKFLALGMSFEEVVRAATARPAAAIGLADLGTLRPGAPADVALFRIHEGHFTFYDVHMNKREGTQLIRNTLTIAGGRPLPLAPDPAPAPWIELSEAQHALIERGHTPGAFTTRAEGVET
ncbi:MAG TPA: amidohydrolase/deacetylase family metallohydrolase [Roseiflexaceae bacterium]|nr:amidohydrolase/deacetylase family metallohydrolase [Roseiflexaceae bacterium]